MNRILITILLFSIAVAGVSQKPRLLLFEHFKNGTVLMKNRAKTSAHFTLIQPIVRCSLSKVEKP